MAKAYIFLETRPGTSRDAIDMLHEIDGLRSVDRVTGPHDIIAVLDIADLESLNGLLAEKVHIIPGVVRTTTCLVLMGSES